MAIVHKNLFEYNISSVTDVDIIFSTRGGILLELDLIWVAKTYFDRGTSTESVQEGDIHALITDTTTQGSPIGQVNVTRPNADSIVIPSFSNWSWQHPELYDLEDNSIVSKLAFNPSGGNDVIGLIHGNLRLSFEPDPAKPVSHSVTIKAKFLAFDSSII